MPRGAAVLLVVLLIRAAMPAATAEGAESETVAFRFKPISKDLSALSKRTLVAAAGEKIEIEGGPTGGVPLSGVSRATFRWTGTGGEAKIILTDGKTVNGAIKSPGKEIAFSCLDLEMAIEVRLRLKAMASLERAAADARKGNPPGDGSTLSAKVLSGKDRAVEMTVGHFIAGDDPDRENARAMGQTLEIAIGDARVRCPLGTIRSVRYQPPKSDAAPVPDAITRGDMLLTLSDGTALKGTGLPLTIRGTSEGLKTDAPKWDSAEFRWQAAEAAPVADGSAREAGTALFAVFTSAGGVASPEILVGKVSDKGVCVNWNGGREQTFEIATNEGEKTVPLSLIKSIAVQDGKTTLERDNGGRLTGTAKAQELNGTAEGFFAEAAKWERAQFTWKKVDGPPPERTGDDPGASWDNMLYEIAAFPGMSFVLADRLLENGGSSPHQNIYASCGGADLIVTSGCKIYGFGPDFVIFPGGERAPVTARPGGWHVLVCERRPGVSMRLICPADAIKGMVSKGRADTSAALKLWDDGITASASRRWKITDADRREITVSNLRGYHFGKDYDDPGAGYYYVGGYLTEDALLGGPCVAVDNGSSTLHFAMKEVKKLDLTDGTVTLGEGGTHRLRGFAHPKHSRDDIDHFMRFKREEQWKSAFLLFDTRVGAVAMPYSKCAKIAALDEPAADGEAGAAASNAPVRISALTLKGRVDMAECRVSYDCKGRFPKSASDRDAASLMLVLGRDEDDDDPQEVSLPMIALQQSEGRAEGIRLACVKELSIKDGVATAELRDGRKASGWLADSLLVGNGKDGEIKIKMADVVRLEIIVAE